MFWYNDRGIIEFLLIELNCFLETILAVKACLKMFDELLNLIWTGTTLQLHFKAICVLFVLPM